MMAVSKDSNNDAETSSAGHDARTQLYLRQSDALPPPINGTIRLVLLSDTHGRHDEIPLPLPAGDILLHLGDACQKGNITQMRSFVKWMKKNSFHKERIVIDGNHDRNLSKSILGKKKRDFMAGYTGVARVLKDEVVEVADGKMAIAGVTWDTIMSEDFSEVNASIQAWNHTNDLSGETEKKVDMVLSHRPPILRGGVRGWEYGSHDVLSNFVKDLSPALHCFGHIHFARGVRANSDITMVNCASTWHEPVVIDYCPNEKRALMVHCPLPESSLDHLRNRKFPDDWQVSIGESNS